MSHNPEGGTQDDMPELPTRQKVDDPLFDFVDGDVEAGGDYAAFVEATVQVDDDLASAVVVDYLKFTDVTFGNVEGRKGGEG